MDQADICNNQWFLLGVAIENFFGSCMHGTCKPGKVILGSGYHPYNGIDVAHGAHAIWIYVYGTHTYGTII